MIVELALVFLVAAHLRHLLESIKHRLYDLVVCSIDTLSDLQEIGSNELCLNATDISREIFDERRNAFPLLARELRFLDRLDVVILYHTNQKRLVCMRQGYAQLGVRTLL